MSTIGTIVVVTALVTAGILLLVCLTAAFTSHEPEEDSAVYPTDTIPRSTWNAAHRANVESKLASQMELAACGLAAPQYEN